METIEMSKGPPNSQIGYLFGKIFSLLAIAALYDGRSKTP